MKSRITIEVDFDKNNEPYIKIHQVDSDDLRDKVLKVFLERLQGDSCWLKIRCTGQESGDAWFPWSSWEIKAIPPSDLKVESEVMYGAANLK